MTERKIGVMTKWFEQSETNLNLKGVPRLRINSDEYHQLPSITDDGRNIVFGDFILNKIDQIEQFEDNEVPTIFLDQAHQSLRNEIDKSKLVLKRAIEKPHIIAGAGELFDASGIFFNEISNNQDLKNKYLEICKNSANYKLIKDYKNPNEGIQRLIRAITVGHQKDSPSSKFMRDAFLFISEEIPDDLFCQMIIEHKKCFDERCDEIKKQLNGYYDGEFKKSILDFMAKYQIKQPELMIRMNKLKDRLLVTFNDLELYGEPRSGGSTKVNGAININAYRNFEKFIKPIFTHEVLHNLGGASYIVLQNEEKIPEEAIYQKIDSKDSNLSYIAIIEKTGLHLYSRFRWLNEGTTELIAKEIYPHNYKSYSEEIKLINNILNKGKNIIPIEILYKAFFEDYDQNLPEGKRMENLKELFRQVSDSFSLGYLVKIDRLTSYRSRSRDIISAINENFLEVSSILNKYPSVDESVLEVIEFLNYKKGCASPSK